MGVKIKNLLGDNVPEKKTREKGIEKVIYFAEIDCQSFEQVGLDKNKVVNLYTILEKSFNKQTDNYEKKDSDEFFYYNCDKQKYLINIIELNDKYCFGKLSTEKKYNDLLEEYRNETDETIYKTITVKCFTFFYIDIEKKAFVYIGHKNLKTINKVFTKYLQDYSNERIFITYYGEKDLLTKIKRSNKLQTIEFQIADNNEISKSIDKTLSWHRNINNYNISIKIKKPTQEYIGQILGDKERYSKIKKPVLKFQDENFNESISHLFENYFTIKETIYINELDIDNFTNIRDKLVQSIKNYMS